MAQAAQSQSFRTKNKQLMFAVVLPIIFIPLIGAGLYFLEKFMQDPIPIIIYTQWQGSTYGVFQKVGASEPETLMVIDESPLGYLLSPDKKFLLIHFASHLKTLDLTAKKVQNLFTPHEWISGVTYSPDASQLLIWDEKSLSDNDDKNSYYVRLLTIASGKDVVLKTGISGRNFIVKKWREDGKILLGEDYSHYLIPYYFDLASNELLATPNAGAWGELSESGMILAVEKDRIEDVCGPTDVARSYDVIDPISGKIIWNFGSSDRRVTVISFSPNDEEVLYKTEKPHLAEADCDKPSEELFFKSKIGINQSSLVKNPDEILLNWSKNYLGA